MITMPRISDTRCCRFRIPSAYIRHIAGFESSLSSRLARVHLQGRLLAALAAWAAAAAHWLAWAYALEFRGHPVHLGVWAAGLVFLGVNVGLLCVLAAACARPPESHLQQVPTDGQQLEALGLSSVGRRILIEGNGCAGAH